MKSFTARPDAHAAPRGPAEHLYKDTMRALSRLCVAVAFALAAMAVMTHPADARTKHHAAHKSSHSQSHKTTHKKPGHSGVSPAILGNSPKYASIIMDANTGRILQQTDPDKVLHPASLTKMMTLMLVFQALKDGRVTLHDQVPMSAHAHGMEPSKLDIPTGKTIRLDNAILAVVTHSANDVAVALAEHVGGTEGTFASMMNRAAAQLGMTHTYFVNACGLHNPKQVTSARDMAILARALIYNYPQQYKYFATRSFSYNGRTYSNHNHLMETYKGMDGLKTGYIGPSGFNLVASVRRGNQRLIGVVFGGQSARWRDQRMASLLDSAFADNAADRANAPVAAIAGTGGRPMPRPADDRITGEGDVDTDTPAVSPTAPASPVSAPASPAAAAAAAVSQSVITRALPLNPAANPAATPAVTPAPPSGGTAANAAISPAAGAGPATPAPTTQVPATTAPADPAHAWGVQIGTYSDRDKTLDALKTVFNNLPAELRHVTAMIVPLSTADGTVYRGRLNGYTRAEAMSVCSRLTNCLTVSPYANN